MRIDGTTFADIEIEVSDGAKKAYKVAAGIGDYFTCFKQDTPTALDDNANAPVASDELCPSASVLKRIVNGMLIIERNGKTYNTLGK